MKRVMVSLIFIFLINGWAVALEKKLSKQKNATAFYTGVYPNLFKQAGYSQADIDAKVDKAYHDLFEGPNKIYFEVGDSMAYVSDIKNHDARTEGLSYGMMVAVQLNKKDVFDRIWRWSKAYLQHKDGPREAYFAWSIINTEYKQVSFTPENNNYKWTDPSYHLPAFFEVWALYAKDGHEQFYKDCADTSRAFLQRACNPVTGLNYDYTEFSGAPRTSRWLPDAFRYDSWRVPMNIAMDYYWFGKDKAWQQDYAKRLQSFFRSKGIDTFEDQFNPDGSRPDSILQAGGFKKLRHSIGLISTVASTEIIYNKDKKFDFVHALWNAKLEPYVDGYFDPYYDGLLYLFSLMHLSGKYQLIKPAKN